MHSPTTRGTVRVAATALVAGSALLMTSVGPASAAQQASTPTAAIESAKPAAVSNAIAFNAPTAPAAGTKMDIEKNTFLIKDLKVALNETVTWTNKDKAPHSINVTAGPEKFDSPLFKQGESFAHKFTKAGAYDYYCAVHPDMVAKVTVDAKAAKPAKKAKKAAAKATKAEKPVESGSTAKDNEKDTKANSDNAHAGMGHGDAAKPSADHQDNDKSSSAPGTSDNGATPAAPAPASPSAPAADPVSAAYDPFMKHLEAAHFQRTAAGQVQDIVELDSWGKAHLALVRTMLDPEVGKSSVVGAAPMAGVFMTHLDAAHWNTSPMEQASAISNFDSWNKSHLAMFRIMFDPIVGKSSVLGSSAGTGLFMQHLDAAHWNQSANEQGSAIADDPAEWTSSHGALFQKMISSLGSGNTPNV